MPKYRYKLKNHKSRVSHPYYSIHSTLLTTWGGMDLPLFCRDLLQGGDYVRVILCKQIKDKNGKQCQYSAKYYVRIISKKNQYIRGVVDDPYYDNLGKQMIQNGTKVCFKTSGILQIPAWSANTKKINKYAPKNQEFRIDCN